MNNRLTLNLGLALGIRARAVDPAKPPVAAARFDQPDSRISGDAAPRCRNQVLNLLATKGYKPTFNGAWVFTDENNRNAWSRSLTTSCRASVRLQAR